MLRSITTASRESLVVEREVRMRAADLLGLVAYLAVMSGGLPDLRLLSAAYRASGDEARSRDTPRLWLVDTNAAPAAADVDGARLEEEAESEADAAVA